MAEESEQKYTGACWCWCALGIAAIVTVIVVLVCTAKDPVYSVTVTGVTGLDDPSSAAKIPMSPVFNLIVRIDNSRFRLSGDVPCIGRLSTVSVSYGNAVLASRGSVPEFCAGEGKVRDRSARVWGKNVDLPQFLWDQLAGELAAGEAAVDVKVTTPVGSLLGGDTVFVCSQVKIGGGPATCQKESVVVVVSHERQANPGFTD